MTEQTDTFTPRTPTRAKLGSYLRVLTPAEFFAPGCHHLEKMAKDLGSRFARCARFLQADDVAQDAAVIILQCAQRWTPECRVPFGGYAWRSAELWLTGAMHRASVPVSGNFDSRATVAGIRYSSLDAPMGNGNDGEPVTAGQVLGWEDCDTGEHHRPDMDAESALLTSAVRDALSDYPVEVADALLGVLHGVAPELDELPPGYTLGGLTREAGRLRVVLGARLEMLGFGTVSRAPLATEQQPCLDLGGDPWLR